MAKFKPGIGRLVAETSLPVVPCYLRGTFHALPASRSLPRPGKVSATIGQPLQFQNARNERSGWDEIARALEDAVRNLTAR
jgi:1-acyl-sn-glycerol-3-phosphate acyltransferase